MIPKLRVWLREILELMASQLRRVMPRHRHSEAWRKWRYAWGKQFRKCTECARTEWYWNCEKRWRRKVPPDLLWAAPNLNKEVAFFGKYQDLDQKLRSRDFLLTKRQRNFWADQTWNNGDYVYQDKKITHSEGSAFDV